MRDLPVFAATCIIAVRLRRGTHKGHPYVESRSGTFVALARSAIPDDGEVWVDEGFRSFPITSRTGRLRRGAAFAQDDMLVVTRGYVALNAPTAEGMVEVHRCGY